ncbi:acyltransferase 3 [Novosphingobium nitrogenifigens DSM 19370]|uniref:Acyltransferase 3 n=1 Tax=Novosphingobium nitrogenifigens DSM 19370 TaxID=983920 RepID=F1ZDV1_9SPHN|nr:hypothetical protein [Novosphingobium nitrogenifigens]EGD57212.1 acyltransferase 3 [Novosphingobium nitrogenifigens DSM 19370]
MPHVIAGDPNVIEGVRGYFGPTFESLLAMFARFDRFSRWLGQIGGVSAGLLGLFYLASIFWPMWFLTLGVSALGALLIGSMWGNPDQTLRRVPSWRPLVEAGKLTYAIYLIHVLCIHAASGFVTRFAGPSFLWTFVASYALALVVGAVVAAAVEQPLIRVGRKVASRLARA